MPFEVGQQVFRIVDGSLPKEVTAWARQALEDTLAVLVAGTQTPLYQAVVRTAAAHPGSRPAFDVPAGTSALWAAHLGSVAASALDFDDGHYRGGGIHAGSTVVPVLLAGAGDITIARLLHAIVAGYEVAIRAGALNAPEHTGESYRASGYAACIGAAAALTAVRGGTSDVIASAVRTAFAHAPHSRMTSAASRESIGWAAATAVATAELASAGFGAEDEDRRHRAPAGPTPFETAMHSAGFACLETYVKPWPTCRAAHAMIECLLCLDTETVETIDVDVVPGAVTLDVAEPANLSEAQYALPWLAAVTLLRGEPAQLRAEDFASPDVVRLASRVRLHPGKSTAPGGGYPARVRLRRHDGTTLEHAVGDNLGSAARPLSPKTLQRKHTTALSTRLSTRNITDLRATLDEPSATVDDLWRCLKGTP
ncbi:MmgE/PrpD family protein [Kineosporia mesophila]|uniref:MmgE/PrpD family protein n=1 Tax=Kineosporia mesophila TaxID=566012 RepID=A0ABP6ZPB7_9ACTN|nr:MmgE/PrpD family protein [Kineosporia mesophila]MCD5354428.1 MmgE/PrpD family protein [Kineosporia mesophila]